MLTPLTDTINSMASQFADAVNNQLAQGYDLNGNPGEPLFIYDASNADGPLIVNPDITADELAFSSSPDESGNSDNLQALINISSEPLEIANLGSVRSGRRARQSSAISAFTVSKTRRKSMPRPMSIPQRKISRAASAASAWTKRRLT